MKWLWGSKDTKSDESEARKLRVIEHNNKNFKNGAISVLLTGSVAVGAAFLCRKSVSARRFIPRKFDSNIYPPQFSPVKDAAKAVVDATLLATSFFSFSVTSTFWLLNVGSLPELGKVLTTMYSPPRTDKVDPESKKVEDSLNAWLSK